MLLLFLYPKKLHKNLKKFEEIQIIRNHAGLIQNTQNES
jgi:hypothetical protein